jgi:hypothetical protein
MVKSSERHGFVFWDGLECGWLYQSWQPVSLVSGSVEYLLNWLFLSTDALCASAGRNSSLCMIDISLMVIWDEEYS